MSKAVELTKDNFNEIIDNNDLVIIDFWAEWCGPCKSFAPTFEAAAEKYDDVVFAKVNTEEQQELAGMFQIRSIPTLLIFKQQIVVFSQPGAVPESGLDQLVDNAKGLDMDMVRAKIAEKAAEKAQAQATA